VRHVFTVVSKVASLCSLHFDALDGEAVLLAADREEVAAFTGSATEPKP
jgi:cysteine sulfinate desulfinase/cysteine desulfurase-like protein